MADWSYGTAGDTYPVKSGEVWQVGAHTLFCGDLELPEHRARIIEIANSAGVQLVYTDPPWNAGNAASFRTKAGVPAKVDFPQFLDNIFGICAKIQNHLFSVCIEGGLAQRELVRSRGEVAGFIWMDTHEILYYRKHPCLLHCFKSPSGASIQIDTSSCDGQDDDYTPGLVIEAVKSQTDLKRGVVLDLCMGRGGTAVSAQERGWASVGMELHPRRMAVTIEKLSQFTNKIYRVE